MFDVFEMPRLVTGSCCESGEFQVYVRVFAVGYTQVRRFDGRAK